MNAGSQAPFALERLGTIMEGDHSNPDEALGVLNPACCRDRHGDLYLFPRVVAQGNLSRIGRARVHFTDDRPTSVERLGYVLEPTEGFERNEQTAGVEDPRICYVAAIDRYVMVYVAYGPLGARVALAISEDTCTWRRLGHAKFAYAPEYQTDFDLYVNKDAMIFPEPVRDLHGRPAIALLHRPDYSICWWSESRFRVQPAGVREPRPSMWISYVPLEAVQEDIGHLRFWFDHQLLAVPEQPWEMLKIGGGTPPVLTQHGWLIVYHGVEGVQVDQKPAFRYCAGVLILDRDDPRNVLYRSSTPVLAPDIVEEQRGVVDNVVFPTGVDVREDGCVDVYYGMADTRIGVARMQVPAALPAPGHLPANSVVREEISCADRPDSAHV